MKTIKLKSLHSEPKTINAAAHIPQNKTEKNPENYATEKVSNGAEQITHATFEQGRLISRKTGEILRRNRSTTSQAKQTTGIFNRGSKAANRATKVARNIGKNGARTVKTTGKAVKTSVKTAKVTAKSTKVAVYTARKAMIATARATKIAARITIQGIKLAIKATIVALKAIAAAIKGLVAAIAAGGWVVLVIILVVAAIAALLCSPFGIFYSNDETQSRTATSVMAELNQELANKIDDIRQENSEASEVVITYEGSEDGTVVINGADILAVFSVRVSMDTDNPSEVVTLDAEKEVILRKTYWDMTHISFTEEPIEKNEETKQMYTLSPSATPESMILTIHVDCLSYDEMISVYSFNANQVEMLNELMQPENQQLIMALLGIQQPGGLTPEEITEIRNNLPENLTIMQSTVVENALSLVGRVHYFWGGKSYSTGWDDRWGVPTEVTSGNNPTTGTIRPFGLDCSGFTAWVYVNSGIPKDKIAEAFGIGTSNQWKYSLPVAWRQAQIGDLAFFSIPGTSKFNHVGVVVSFDDEGNPMVANCSSDQDTVVVTEGWGSGFRYIRRPVAIS